jgi:hypothetical protein
MSQSPRRQDSALDLEALSAEELERVLVTRTPVENSQPEAVLPPINRRCDSNHREILRQPFFLDR